MRLVVIGLACVLGLGGCISSERMSALKAEVAALKVERDAKRITYTQWANKYADALHATGAATADDNLGLAYQTLLASKVDRGEITPEMLDFEMAKVGAALAQKDQQRRMELSNALITAGAAMMTPPPPIQPTQGPISCTSYRVGQFIQTTC
jgi:uncharacterized small protein (DUF1192 family)